MLLARVRALFDVDCDPFEISRRLEGGSGRGSGSDSGTALFTPGTRLPGCLDPFEMSVRAILGQQVTVKAARTLAMRFAQAFGAPLATPFTQLTHTFPTHGVIAGLDLPVEDRLGPLGITGARARSIFALAKALSEGTICLAQHANPEEEMQKLLALPGFGPWTVQYVAMRALAWPDAFPHTDYGVKKALEGLSPKEIMELAETWRPWRSYATIALWDSLSNNVVNTEKGA
jgi:AraC family transcriptional regulator of adaptative response / DNA-3-methyladenine glycosylase II